MSDKIPARFRKTKTGKWAVMAPVADLERALAEGSKVDVLRKSGDWTTFRVASLGRPFDVDGVPMCYGYGPEDDETASTGGAVPSSSRDGQAGASGSGGGRSAPPPPSTVEPPPLDATEPLPEYQGSAEDEWAGEF